MLPSSSSSSDPDDPEDVFSFFVQSLGEKPFAFTPSEVCYGDVRVTTAEKGESDPPSLSSAPSSFLDLLILTLLLSLGWLKARF